LLPVRRWEDAVDEDDAVFGEILGGFRLNSNVEEADAVVELFAGTDCLAADGGEGLDGMSGSCGFRGWIEREGFRLNSFIQDAGWRRRRGRGVRIGAGKLLYSESGELCQRGQFCRRIAGLWKGKSMSFAIIVKSQSQYFVGDFSVRLISVFVV
jgi:hypothetical protein